VAFIRWRRSRGYKVAPFKRQFWGRHAWKKRDKFAPLFAYWAHELARDKE
jgi:hypothetical protein